MQEYDFNKLVFESGLDLMSVVKTRLLFLLLGEKGDLLHIWQQRFFDRYDTMNKLTRIENIFAAFDFDDIKDLADSRLSEKLIPNRRDFFYGDYTAEFTTSLPLLLLRVKPLLNKQYLGVVAFPNILPNTAGSLSNAMLVVDESDNLIAFNRSFFGYFKTLVPSPWEIIGKPCSGFISPTPSETQITYCATIKETDFVFAEKALDCDCSSSGEIKGITVSDPSSIEKHPDGWKWVGSSIQGNNTILFELPIIPDKQDFCVDLCFRLVKGWSPVILFQEDYSDGPSIGMSGYTAGEEISRRRAVLKKSGYPVKLGQEMTINEGGMAEISLKKIGAVFILFYNGRETYRYYDFDFPHGKTLKAAINIRVNSVVIIKGFSLSVKKTVNPVFVSDQFVSLKIADSPAFAISRFFVSGLSSGYPWTNGFVLRDITFLKNEVERWQKLYRKEKSEGARLRTLLSGINMQDNFFLGENSAIRNIKSKADIVAKSKAAILIEGETGTGKEILANYIHQKSNYSGGPFVKVDCSVLAPSLVESELFGHEKGAFTGAVGDREGKLEQANGGTLFLDEVNNLSLDIQIKLLGFLQDFSIVRLGGTKRKSLDLRIIAASNIPLADLVARKLFREDLFYRMNTVSLILPPLRERKDDLPLLCSHFLNNFNLQLGKDVQGISPDAYRKMYSYSWPGNIRELRNVVYHAVIFSEGIEIDDSLIVFQSQGKQTFRPAAEKREPKIKRLTNMSNEELKNHLSRMKGNVKELAKELGVSRTAIYFNMRKWEISPEDFRSD